MAPTGFYSDEKCFWHGGGHYASMAPVGGFVQPMGAGGLPENPETKRRLKNLLEVSGLMAELATPHCRPASDEDALRVHTARYINAFKALSAGDGGELGQRTPFGPGGYEIGLISAGLTKSALFDVLDGKANNAYALSRPPGHHCLADYPMGFCLLANIAIAIEAAIAAGKAKKFAVVDWDVHHGNGTEAIFLDRNDVLTISLHQENNYPPDSGSASVVGIGPGKGCNINIPLPPGAGDLAYRHAFERIVVPSLTRFAPQVVIIACGFDASGIDPLSRMLATSETFRVMTRQLMAVADTVCSGKLVAVHEGGYSELHVPFCGHAVIEELSGTDIQVPDPLRQRLERQQPSERFTAEQLNWIDELAVQFGTG